MDTTEDDKLNDPMNSLQEQNKSLLAELENLSKSQQTLELKHEDELEDVYERNIELAMLVEELTIQRDCLKSELFAVEGRVKEREEEFMRRIYDEVREKECLELEIYEGVREREELVRKIDKGRRENEEFSEGFDGFDGISEEVKESFCKGLEVLGLIKKCMMRVSEGLGEKELEREGRVDDVLSFEEKGEEWRGMKEFLKELNFVLRIVKRVEEKLSCVLKEIEACKKKNKELEESFCRGLEILGLVKESLVRINEGLDEEKSEEESYLECDDMKEDVLNFEDELEGFEVVNLFLVRLDYISRMVKRVENKLNAHQEKVKKEKRALESSVMSLTEENRDVNALLRIALVEKEAVEKKLRGSNEQKRAPLLQFAERGLQRVGFGFIMGGTTNEQYEHQKKDVDQTSESLASYSSAVSDVSSECEEEAVSLASTVEKMMKNLRLEIAQLRRALEESRSDSERLQTLTEKQVQQIRDYTVYITELEARERTLTQHVEELLTELKSNEEDIVRWRKACELEVEAGKRVLQERDKVVAILTQELEKTKVALQVSNSKLKLKEELVVAAMAAQSAAERCLQLADSRAVGLREKNDALTRQLEEAEVMEKNNRRKVRRICWPWQALRSANPANAITTRGRNIDIRRMLPEMQALLHKV